MKGWRQERGGVQKRRTEDRGEGDNSEVEAGRVKEEKCKRRGGGTCSDQGNRRDSAAVTLTRGWSTSTKGPS